VSPAGSGDTGNAAASTRLIRDVAAVPLGRVQAHLVLEPEPSLIDCGYARSRGRIEKAMSEHGSALADLARVVCTHGHPDHAGGARELALAGIPVLIHPADGERLAITWREMLRQPSRGKFFAAMTPEPPQTVPIENGDVLPMLGGLRVIHTPGHTPGSVCFFGARDRILFVGDTLQRRFGRVSFASVLYSDDITMARRAVQRLASLDVETVVFSHYPPLTEGASETLASLARRLD
jgi:glyoxylase-like metal-dependent hydrolase (beta-lactamase superfamily II)